MVDYSLKNGISMPHYSISALTAEAEYLTVIYANDKNTIVLLEIVNQQKCHIQKTLKKYCLWVT